MRRAGEGMKARGREGALCKLRLKLETEGESQKNVRRAEGSTGLHWKEQSPGDCRLLRSGVHGARREERSDVDASSDFTSLL